ncbi:MAG: glycosyltransferase [Nitrospiraceae bacterium]|nr:glycosyltransferase [Nitrospiraceae bacterium]
MIIAHISTFPPLRCGIASFASDLIDSMPYLENRKYCLHYGENAAANISGQANVNSADEITNLAKQISESNCDAISLQHEFGIWGGREGENIIPFLNAVNKPIVSILHTTFGPGVRSKMQVEIIDSIVRRSSRVIVLTETAKSTLEYLLGRRLYNLSTIAHGIPTITYTRPSMWSNNGNGSKPLRLITPGFFREDKGLEAILFAIWRLKLRGRNLSYVIAGEPQQQFGGQNYYYSEINKMIQSLNLSDAVTILGRYLPFSEQIRVVQDSHVGIFAYQDPSHASSGTVPLVMSSGRPVICTPFEYAKAKKIETGGVFIAHSFSATSIAETISKFMDDNQDSYLTTSEKLYDATRSWTWENVGHLYRQEYSLALQQFGQR